MAKGKKSYECSECSYKTVKWMGKCPECESWGTLDEVAETISASTAVGTKSKGTITASNPAQRIQDVSTEYHKHQSTGIGELDRVLGGGLVAGGVIMLAGPPGVGKALSLDTPIATLQGWKNLRDIVVGDYVFGDDGKPTMVVALSEIWENRPCYEVVFSDGSTIIADENHEWITSTRGQRVKATKSKRETYSKVRTTLDIKNTLFSGNDNRLTHSVSVASALQLEEASLPIPPYALGAWLGDGNSNSANITSYDPEIPANITSDGGVNARPLSYGKEIYKLEIGKPENWGVNSSHCGECESPYSDLGRRVTRENKGYCKKCQHDKYSFVGMLRNLEVLNNKHIPMSYLRASESQRRLLLAGLMDTNGTISKSGILSIGLTSKSLAYGVLELILSLGHRVNMTTKRVNGASDASSICYIMNFTTTTPVFRLTRKLERQNSSVRKTNGRRYIKEVNQVASVPVRCIEVSNESHLFLAGKEMIPTHNSSILAMVSDMFSQTQNVLYVSGEESIQQIKIRHERMNAMGKNLYIAAESDLAKVLWQIDEVKPKLLIIDSLQTIASGDFEGRAGSVSQVTEVATILTRIAKERSIPTIFVGHYTKDGNVAGPRVVEHLVDVVLAFEGEDDSPLRLLRGIKNRFGPSDEIGCFEHTETGLEEVPDPSGMLRGSRESSIPGVATSIYLEGKRALPVEIQAVVLESPLPNPRKGTSGLDPVRTLMLQAILQKHSGHSVRIADKDVYVSTAAGIKVREPAVDLATMVAIASDALNLPSRFDAVCIGEVTLSGEIRKVQGIVRRVSEAVRLGFNVALVPVGTKELIPESMIFNKETGKRFGIIEIKNLSQLVSSLKAVQASIETGILK